ncbi:DUF397 domain-containing protein [Streptomyces durbertensis]|uniref:DUF397 domain-containing protein n=1 Tax=Streptomyces durbertensis TaxID=2448886 RepID=A0ABR6EH95_9ACTN|nr:DUF397 domain-containing protein [Streptomyces durbertensis]MBB1244528.1 DUF397 domain-containing protein [Streptomyces durbertensis]
MTDSPRSGWRKSSYSGADNGACVEVGYDSVDMVPIRDSKRLDLPHIVVPADAWSTFVSHLKR